MLTIISDIAFIGNEIERCGYSTQFLCGEYSNEQIWLKIYWFSGFQYILFIFRVMMMNSVFVFSVDWLQHS